MVVGGGVLSVLSLLLLVYCLMDLATSRPADVRTLPKPVWFPVLLLPVLGPVAWLVAGRPRPGSGRAVPKVLPDAAPPSTAPDDDEAFLRELRRRAEEQRRRVEEQRRRAEEQRRRAQEHRAEDGPPDLGERPPG